MKISLNKRKVKLYFKMSSERAKKFNRDLSKDDLLKYRLNYSLRLRKNKLEDMLMKKRLCSTAEKDKNEENEESRLIQKLLKDKDKERDEKNYKDSENCSPNDIENYSTLLSSSEKNKFLSGLVLLRKCLSTKKRPPIQKAIQTGIVKQVLRLFENLANPECHNHFGDTYEEILFESLWILSNIASGSGDGCTYLLENQILQNLKRLFPIMKSEDIINQSLWLIANLAGDENKIIRNWMVKFDYLNYFGKMLKTESYKIKNSCLWALSNIFTDAPVIPFSFREELQEIVSNCKDILVNYKNYLPDNNPNEINLAENTLFYNTTFLYLLTCSNNWVIEMFVDEFTILSLIRLIKYAREKEDYIAVLQFLRLIGNFSMDDMATWNIVNHGILTILKDFLHLQHDESKLKILKEILFILSNITAGVIQFSDIFFEEKDLLESVLFLAHNDQKEITNEAIWCLANITISLDRQRLIKLMNHNYMDLMAFGIKSKNFKLSAVCLEALENIFRFAEGQYNDIILQRKLYIECLKVDIKVLIESLSMSDNDILFEKASDLLSDFFSYEYELKFQEDVEVSTSITENLYQ
jgi:hypothetical protein